MSLVTNQNTKSAATNGVRIPWTRITMSYCHGLPALLGAVVFALIFVGVWQIFFRGAVVSYGDPAKTYFFPTAAKEGDDIELCFDDIVWKRLCPSILVTHLLPTRGPRIDLPSYRINVPAVAARVPPKCRAWKVPTLGANRAAGPAVLSGFVESYCTPMDRILARPIYTELPTAKLDISKRAPVSH